MIWYAQRLAAICLIFSFATLSTISAAAQEPAAQEPATGAPWSASWATSIARLGDSDRYVAATADGLLMREAAVVEFSWTDLSRSTTLYLHPASVWGLAASDSMVCSSDYRGNLGLLNRETSEASMHEGVLERWTRALAISPDGQSLVAGNEAGKLLVWSFVKSEVIQSAELDAQQIYSIAFSPAGNQIAVSDGGGHVHVLSWPELGPVRQLELGEQPVWAARFTRDGQRILAGGADRKLWLAPLTEGSTATVISETSDWITSIEPGPDSSTMVVGTLSGGIMIVSGGGVVLKAAIVPSAVWNVSMPRADTILAATRKHAIASLKQTWDVDFAVEPGVEQAAANE